ncbi:MAG: helix-turn-helix domain-containing protein [Candidatus Omnitrophica bacterium]|nr:helix-turn-helix domain-containing protein [Candidatus Omnitrophota bacterium]
MDGSAWTEGDGKLLTEEEAAALLEIGVAQLRAMVEEGKLPAYQIGGTFLRFRRDQVEALKEPSEPQGETSEEGAVDSDVFGSEDSEAQPNQSTLLDRVLDLVYFNDFYLVSVVLILALLCIIFLR